MKDVIALKTEHMDRILRPDTALDSMDDLFDDCYPSHLRHRELDWEVPAPMGTVLNYAEEFNDVSPNGRVRDLTTTRFDLDEWRPDDAHLRIADQIRELLTGTAGNQLYWIQFYQIPAPKLTQIDGHRKREYLEELFRAQDAISNDAWIRTPQILLESGGEETILGDTADAEWVADMYPQLREKHAEIGFLVDAAQSVDAIDVLRELPDGTVKKVRVNDRHTEITRVVSNEISISTIM